MTNEEVKKMVKQSLSLSQDFSIWEIIEALLANDEAKLTQIRNRKRVLDTAYTQFEATVDSGDEARKQEAIRTFQRPPL